ncbi:MAG: hypothetical protein K6B71_01265 [Alphaproteobacteria bacterium]|nr:hypothetical protein [Alphaproteobacteria bacterium]
MKKFLSKISIAIMALIFCVPHSFALDEPAVVTGDIGDFGTWATEPNRQAILTDITNDVNALTSKFNQQYANTGVPVEAKLGIALVGGLAFVTEILDMSLVKFVSVFLVIAFLFLLSFDIYKKMTDGKGISKDDIKDWVKRSVILAIWLVLLGGGLRQLFSLLMGPIVGLGSYISGMIIDSVFATGNVQISDTCLAIKQYAASNLGTSSVIDAETAGNIMCVPTRLSEFYYSAIKYGWSLVVGGLGVSVFTVLVGLAFVALFTYAAFKFAFVAFGVISELFLVIIMLPFTAINETIGKTTYTGIPGQIFNSFLGLFKSSSLSDQVNKFIQTAIYFISMAIVVAIGGAILANAVSLNQQTGALTVVNGDTLTLLISGALVAYLAMHIDDIVKQIGGAIDFAKDKSNLGTVLEGDVMNILKDQKNKAVKFINILRKKGS